MNYLSILAGDNTGTGYPESIQYSQESIEAAKSSGKTHFGIYFEERRQVGLLHGVDGIMKQFETFYGADGILISFYHSYGLEQTHLDIKNFLEKIEYFYTVNLNSLKYWVNGIEGFQILIPNALFCNNERHPNLPYIHAYMVNSILDRCYTDDTGSYVFEGGYTVLPSLARHIYSYTALARSENILGPNKCYKIPVTHNELVNLSVKDLLNLALSQKNLQNTQLIEKNPILSNLFQTACLEYTEPCFEW